MKSTTAKSPSRARRILKRAGLVALLTAFGAVVAGGGAYHGARAQVSENLWDLGSQMMRYAESRNQDAPRDLVINGQVIRVSSGTADRPAREVLDYFEQRCGEVDGGLTEQVDELRRRYRGRIPEDRSSSPVLREDDGRQGYVACMDFGQSIGVIELAQRLQRFGETGDVSHVGQMRFVFVESRETPQGPRTHFVAMWTTGSFDLDRMFPETGDAPGADPEGFARPPRTRRVLSSFERGEPYSMTVYHTRDDQSALEMHYRRELSQNGWSLLEPPREAPADAPRTLVAERGDRMVTIVFDTDLESGLSSAAVIDVR